MIPWSGSDPDRFATAGAADTASGELRNAKWEEIDFETAIWSILLNA